MKPDVNSVTNNLFGGSLKSNENLAAMARDNPTFASYFALAVAAMTRSNLNSDANFNTVPSANMTTTTNNPQVDVLVKQGNSRCTDCNIVFFKQENYLVHKEKYCASRRNIDNSQTKRASSSSITRPGTSSPSGSTGNYSNQHGATEIARTSNKSDDVSLSVPTSPSVLSSREGASVSPNALLSPGKQSNLLQYYCIACGIKYTSYDNLQAHQTYYCLKRNTNTALPNATNSVSPVNPMSPSPQPSSAQSLLSPQMLSTVAAAASLGTQSNASADSIMDFSSSLSNNFAGIVAAAVANAKSNLSSGTFGDFNCNKCKASYMSQETLAAHVCSADLRLEKTEKSPNVTPSTSSLQTYKCTICGYKGHTMRGMRTHVRVHSSELSSGACEEDFIVQNTDLPEPSSGRRGVNHGNSLANVARLRRRSTADQNYMPIPNLASPPAETLDILKGNYLDTRRNRDLIDEQRTCSNGNDGGLGVQSHKCKYCPYTSNYKGNVMRHIKLVHKVIKDNTTIASMAVHIHQQHTAKDAMDSVTDNDETSSVKSDEDGGRDSVSIKSPLRNEENNSENTPNNTTAVNSVGANSPETTSRGDTGTPTPGTNTTTSTTTGNHDLESNYCSSCNISFTYRNSYLAHKKYYCSSHHSDP